MLDVNPVSDPTVKGGRMYGLNFNKCLLTLVLPAVGKKMKLEENGLLE